VARLLEKASWAAACAGLALVYWALGRLALPMAIPPGYATAVWPAAGVGLAVLLVYGRRLWPGVWIGSLLVNLPTTLDRGVAGSVGVAASIGAGAALQALLGATLVRRVADPSDPLETERSIVRFLILAGPVSCVISAAWGVTTLVIAGVVPPATAAFSAFTWWIGDAIGVVIFAPVTLTLIGRPEACWRPRRWTVGLPLLLGALVVATLFVKASAWEQAQMDVAFDRRASAVAQAIQRRLDSDVEILHSVSSFLDVEPDVSRRDFEVLVKPALRHARGVTGIAWLPRVSHGQRPAFEARARPIFEVGPEGPRPAARREVYHPIAYLEPVAGHETLVGYDVGSEPRRRETLGRAEADRIVLATPPIRLFDGERGFLVFDPVFDRATAEGVVVRGFVVAAFRAADLAASALDGLDRNGLAVALEDPEAGIERSIYGEPAAVDARAYEAVIRVAGRNWIVRVAPTPSAALDRSWQAWVVLAAGLLFVALIGTLQLVLTGRAHALAQAEARYRDLYERSPDMYASVSASGVIFDFNETLATVLGRSKAELLGRPVIDLYDPSCVEGARAAFSAFAEGRKVDDVELVLRSGAGPIDVLLSMSAVYDAGGVIVRGRSVWRNITARKQAERDRAFLFELGEHVQSIDAPELLVERSTAAVAAYLGPCQCSFSEAGPSAPSSEDRLGVSLVREGHRVGSLSVTSEGPRSWSNRELFLLESALERMWARLENIRIRKALEASEEKYRSIVETTREGVWQVDADARTTFVNRRMAAMLGYSVEDLLTRPIDDFLDPEGRAIAGERIARAIGGVVESFDFKLTRTDGSEIWTLVAASPVLDPSGKTVGAQAVFVDITERKRAEADRERLVVELERLSETLEVRVDERTQALQKAHEEIDRSEQNLRAVIERAPIGILVHRLGPIAYVNPALVSALGYQRASELIGRSVVDLVHADDRSLLLGSMARRSGSGASIEARLIRADGTTVRMEAGGILVPFDDEPAMLLTLRDVTAERAAEAALRASLAEKEVLLREVHHRVKNNLQVIASLLSLQSQRSGDAARPVLQESWARVHSIALVHEKLYGAKDLSHVDFDDYVRSLVESLLHAHGATSRGIRSEITLSGGAIGVDAAIPCGLIINEIVSNALEHAFPDGRSGTIQIKLDRPAARELELLVADDGVGLPEGMDLHRSGSLGLDLIFTFAEQLDAVVEVKRRPGTAFQFRFPGGE
jgi:PAS domain S-box-containing protein